MDLLTQASLGALCGELFLRKQLGWKGTLWGVCFGLVPDLDVLATPDLGSLDYLTNHRGLSHSLFLMLLMSPVFGWLLAQLHQSLSTKRASLFVLLAWSTHVLIDCFNSYGTQIFEPFSNYRVTLNNMSIIDPLFTLPMVIGVIWALFYQRKSAARTSVVTVTTSWISAYAALSFLLLGVAQHKLQAKLESAGISATESTTTCALGNIMLWRMLARDENNYYITYWSLWDAEDRLVEVDTIPRNPELAAPYRNSEAFRALDWFSQGWWKIIPDGDNSIVLADMRFGEMHSADGKGGGQKIPPFLWRLTINDKGEISQSRTSLRGDFQPGPTLQLLGNRIAGDAPNWMSHPWPWDTPAKNPVPAN